MSQMPGCKPALQSHIALNLIFPVEGIGHSLFFHSYFTVCHTTGPLGMITGAIQDWQISASSAYPNEWDRKCREKYARVYLENKYGWCAKYKSASEWLQVDLGVSSRVSSDVMYT